MIILPSLPVADYSSYCARTRQETDLWLQLHYLKEYEIAMHAENNLQNKTQILLANTQD
jgi:hypothetical protein